MLCKLITTFLLAMPLLFGGIFVPIQRAGMDVNNTVIKNSAISDENMAGNTSADLFASDDKTLTDVNIVNYNVSTGATTFEYFDKYSYETKNSNGTNSVNKSSLNTSVGNAVAEVNVPFLM